MSETLYFRSEVGEPGKTGLHGDWLEAARAIYAGCLDECAIAFHCDWSDERAANAVRGMEAAYVIQRQGHGLTLLRKGLKRMQMAEANGR